MTSQKEENVLISNHDNSHLAASGFPPTLRFLHGADKKQIESGLFSELDKNTETRVVGGDVDLLPFPPINVWTDIDKLKSYRPTLY